VEYPLIYYTDLSSNALPLFAGLCKWNNVKQNPWGAGIVFAFTILVAVTEVVNYLMVDQHIRNLWVLHVYNLAEYSLLMFVFFQWFRQSERERMEKGIAGHPRASLIKPAYLIASIVIYSSWWLVSKWTLEKWDEPPSYSVVTSTIIFISFSLVALYQLVRRSAGQDRPIHRRFQFWIAFGILLYFAGSAMDFLLLPLIATLPAASVVSLWEFHWGVDIAANICYAIGYLCLSPQSMA